MKLYRERDLLRLTQITDTQRQKRGDPNEKEMNEEHDARVGGPIAILGSYTALYPPGTTNFFFHSAHRIRKHDFRYTVG